MKATRWIPWVAALALTGCGGGGSGNITGIATPSPVITTSAMDGTFGSLTVNAPAVGNDVTLTVQPVVFSNVGSAQFQNGTALSFSGSTLSSSAVAASSGSFNLAANRTLSLSEGANTSVSGFLSTTSNTAFVNLQNSTTFPFQILSRVTAQPSQSVIATTLRVTEGTFAATTSDLGQGTLTLNAQGGVTAGSVTNVTNGLVSASFTGGTLTVNADGSISGTLVEGFATPVTWTVAGFLGQDGSVLLSLSDTGGNLAGFIFGTPTPLAGASNASLSGALQVETPVTTLQAVSNGSLTFSGSGTISSGELLSANNLGASLLNGSYQVNGNGTLASLTYSLSNGFTVTSTGGTLDWDSAFMYGLFNNQIDQPFFEVFMK